MARPKKRERQEDLTRRLQESPFLTDEELARALGVSVQTVRLDRMELRIPELRTRVRQMAEGKQAQDKTSTDFLGELKKLEPGRVGISRLRITKAMAAPDTQVARGHVAFLQASSLAHAVLGTSQVAEAANVKYTSPAYVGEELVAKAEVTRRRGKKSFIRVCTQRGSEEIFRAKFLMVAVDS